MTVLPAELVRRLRAARRVENVATNQDQRRRAITASGALMLAARRAGWPLAEIAAAMRLEYPAARKRLDAARRRDLPAVGLELETPPARQKGRVASLRAIPVSERDLLTRREALEHAGVAARTLTQWRQAGLLPNCTQLTTNFWAYSRRDLDRVMAAPRYRGNGVDRAALLAQIGPDGGAG